MTAPRRRWPLAACVLTTAMLASAPAWLGANETGKPAGDSHGKPTAAASAAEKPASGHDKPAADQGGEDAVQELMRKRIGSQGIEPTQRKSAEQTPVIDPRILGPAPGGNMPKLRREGEFVVSRRGRLVRAQGAAGQLFVFDSDDKTASDPPMFIMPCQLLESMEELTKERGDAVVFVVTGQVYTYRGANYLLPSIMKLAVDKGNLTP